MEENFDKFLKKYHLERLLIDEIETYVIPRDIMELLEGSGEISEQFSISSDLFKRLFCDVVRMNQDIPLFAGLIHTTEMYRQLWFPILCLKTGRSFCHIHYHPTWICRDCGHCAGRVLMPLSESERIYYIGHPVPAAPEIFRKRRCTECGSVLQNHLIMLDEWEKM